MRPTFTVVAVLIALSGATAFAQSYDDLARQPAAYKGKVVSFQGKVVQALQDGTTYVLRVNVTPKPYKIWTDTVWVEYRVISPTEPRILEGDMINFRGLFGGIKSYKAVMGQMIQIPYVVACEVSDANSTFKSVPVPCDINRPKISSVRHPADSEPATSSKNSNDPAERVSENYCKSLRSYVCNWQSDDNCTSKMKPDECDKFIRERNSCLAQGWWPNVCAVPTYVNPYRD